MKRRRLIWKLFPLLWMIIILSLLAVTIFFSQTFKDFHLEQTSADLQVRANLVRSQTTNTLIEGEYDRIDSLCKQLGDETNTRITIILPSGKVIADSQEDPDRMDNHAKRSEIMEALSGGVGGSTRYSYTIHKNLMYVAIPMIQNGNIIGVVRTSRAVASINEALKGIYLKMALGALMVVILIAIASIFTIRRVSLPLEQMRKIAHRFSDGELSLRLPEHNSLEIGGLSEAMNQMAAQLNERIQTILKQRNEQEAVLSSMVEAVLAVDLKECVIDLNRAAESILNVEGEHVKGRYIHEIVRSTDLLGFVRKVLVAKSPAEEEFSLGESGEKYLQAKGATLRDASGSHIGAVIVLNDITRLRRLENLRRDFVANVSHELRTPITSIKGFVETLVEGGVENPEDKARFLNTILKQSDRLNSIVEDLLSLSTIEQESEKREIALIAGSVKDVLHSSIQSTETKAKEKKIRIVLSCDENVTANINADLLEQAVNNLIDNAINYSEPGSTIEIGAVQKESYIVINVRDYGCGIEGRHLPRLFERFYRVDKARSRKFGGTGLGLAIVKHIAQAHGGFASVESEPGKGSTFSIHLPKT
jgi:two-component system phosphate regulon sensor histidine kinase PhoR